MITCEVCKEMLQDLSSHIRWRHGIDTTEYRRRYPGSPIVDQELADSRSSNRDAKAATEKTADTWAAKYDGGHPMTDPKVVRSHLIARELNGHRYDHEAAKNTNKEKYGVDYHAQTAEHRESSRQTMIKLIAEGKIKKPEKTPCHDPEKLRSLSSSGTKRSQMCREMGCSDHVLKNWLKDLGLPIVDSRKVTDASGNEIDPLSKIRDVHSKFGTTTRDFVSSLPKEDFPFHYSTVEKKYGSWSAFLSAAGIGANRHQLSPRERLSYYLGECLKQRRLLTTKEYGAHHGGGEHSSAIYSLLNGKLAPLKDELGTFFPSEQWVSAFLAKVETMI